MNKCHDHHIRQACGLSFAVCCGLLLTLGASAAAENLRVLPTGQVPQDSRLGPLKDLDGYFPFTPSPTIDDWNARADHLRTAMRVALGLWPMPSKTPAHAVVHGRLDMGDYTVEKVYLESFPGFFVTGNLYRPHQATGKCPGVLCPHGHFADGRFGASSRLDVRRQIVAGAERFEEGGRNSIQARCVQLARMGCVVFNYDMVGYCDSGQISFDLAHRFARQRPEMISSEPVGSLQPAGGIAPAECDGSANLQLHPRPGLARTTARRRSAADRRDRAPAVEAPRRSSCARSIHVRRWPFPP